MKLLAEIILALLVARAAYASGSAIASLPIMSSRSRVFHVAFGGTTESTACTSSPCTIFRQSDDEGLITTVDSVVRSSTGTYTINVVSGRCSAPPSCVVMLSGVVANLTAKAGTPTNTSFPIQIVNLTANVVTGVVSSTLIDGGGNAICQCLK